MTFKIKFYKTGSQNSSLHKSNNSRTSYSCNHVVYRFLVFMCFLWEHGKNVKVSPTYQKLCVSWLKKAEQLKNTVFEYVFCLTPWYCIGQCFIQNNNFIFLRKYSYFQVLIHLKVGIADAVPNA